MPVFGPGPGLAPGWCELMQFEIVRLQPGETHAFERAAVREKLIVGDGDCRIATHDGDGQAAATGANLDLGADGQFRITEVTANTAVIRMCGRWGDDLGGSGLFAVNESDERTDRGDPVSYAKKTSFDRHFHDCDEYWILFEGRGVAMSEGQLYEVGPGDCVATGMGHHHDFPIVHAPVRSVYFETTMEGQMRRGHLWEHAHGAAQPRPERV
jgi:mannose-6-phosphate isomerase-like protein (cupin superfamily)